GSRPSPSSPRPTPTGSTPTCDHPAYTDKLTRPDFRDNGAAVSLNRAFTIPVHRGRGHAAALTAGAVEDIATNGGPAGGRRIVPMCWYVAQWFDEHPEKSALLAPR
ncbi:GCN5-related N-acetyltransferase, partial [Micrococcus sp. KT16]